MLTTVILAGGLGTRLRPVISNRPKSLAEVGSRPFLERLLDKLGAEGVEEVILCTGHLGHQIREQIRDNCRGVRVLYSEEASPLGTAGALRLALPLLGTGSVLVMNGDSFYDGCFRNFVTWHDGKDALASILLSRVEDSRRFGRVEINLNDEITRFVEKDPTHAEASWVSAGVYVIQNEVVQNIAADRPLSLERDVFPQLIGSGLFGYRGEGEFLDIGTPESYIQAEVFLDRVSGRRPPS